MASVTIDTMMMIWGIKGVSTPGQEDMIERAQRLLQSLADDKIHLVLTSHAVAEYLGAFPPDKRDAQYVALQEYFPIVPFDLRATEVAADLLYNKDLIKSIQQEFQVSRQVVKADMAIIATAVAAGVQTLYSHDGKFIRAAQGKIIVKDVPALPVESHSTANLSASTPTRETQRSLFSHADDDTAEATRAVPSTFLSHLRKVDVSTWGRQPHPIERTGQQHTD